MKKILAVAMSVIMLMGLSVTSFAVTNKETCGKYSAKQDYVFIFSYDTEIYEEVYEGGVITVVANQSGGFNFGTGAYGNSAYGWDVKLTPDKNIKVYVDGELAFTSKKSVNCGSSYDVNPGDIVKVKYTKGRIDIENISAKKANASTASNEDLLAQYYAALAKKKAVTVSLGTI